MTDRRLPVPTQRLRTVVRWLPAAALAALAACSAASFAADADAEVDSVLAEATSRTLGDRESTVLRPEVEPLPTEPPAVADPPGQPPAAAPGPTLRLDLTEALATACRQNREFLARREGLYREGLSIALTRFEFGPQFAAAVNYLWRNSELGGEAQRSGGSVSASQILPTGGRVSVSAGLDADWLDGTSQAFFGTNTGISLTQPLLRGAGPEIAYEALTQAERGLVYAVREFELFRQGFSIQIAQQFFGLSSQRQTLANEDRNYENAVFDTRKAEALQQVGRNSEQEVFRARRREIDAKDQLINARAAYDRALDDFKIVLGLPTTTVLDLADVEPPYEPVRFEVTSAIAAARNNRLDLITDRQRLQDTERSLRIAENGLLPDLSLTANYGTAGSGDDLGVAAPDQWSSSIGLSLDVPLQRKAQRNSYRSALIALEQARRSLQQTEDQLELDIRDAVRRLRSTEERIALQEAQIVQEERAQTVIQIRYDAGTADNRDLFEARQALIDARNALIRLKVEHFIARLNLQKDMGIFFVDDRGMWR